MRQIFTYRALRRNLFLPAMVLAFFLLQTVNAGAGGTSFQNDAATEPGLPGDPAVAVGVAGHDLFYAYPFAATTDFSTFLKKKVRSPFAPQNYRKSRPKGITVQEPTAKFVAFPGEDVVYPPETLVFITDATIFLPVAEPGRAHRIRPPPPGRSS